MEKQPENNSSKNKYFLLHSSYKRMGYWLCGFALLGLAWKKIVSMSIVLVQDIGKPAKPDAANIVLSIVFILGLVCIAWAKEKTEDEMFQMFRTRSMMIAFVLAVLYVMIVPLIELFGGNTPRNFSGIYLVTGMLLVYLLSFNLQKRSLL